jgi:predicted Zn-dependent protease
MKTKRFIALLIMCSFATFFFSCATGSNVVGSWQKVTEEITQEQEYYIGRAVAANILGGYKLQTNKPALTAYVNKITNAIVVNSEKSEIFNGYHAAILDSDEINAFATPGGHIFLTRGLINSAASEDALASVIAHEIAHIQLRHGIDAIKDSRKINAAVETGKAAVDLFGPVIESKTGVNVSKVAELSETLGFSVDDIVTTMITNGYSQKQEFEADAKALELLSSAGYEPSSLLEVLNVLEKNQTSRPGGFNKTHPTPAQRIANVQKTVGNFSVEDTRSFRTTRYAAAVK